ncbi:MAG: GNAT family N-acetyltransferase [Roseiflexus sp.]|nr:GNAT family N-acetyltransferase [Roseiflexus sp.]MDW8146866.1 GNAT family N-acetyltransferase [Roseiflexaceae bacterium]MDW8234009.1 GNAT family N-acetyltransferase [Roseiflexaceae bacterium]
MTVHVCESQIFVVPPRAPDIIVRRAEEEDVDAIAAIVAENARQGHLLPRSVDNIRATLSSWLVAEVDGNIAGIGSLVQMSPTLVEVRSLAVVPEYRGLGIGQAIVRGLVDEARRRGFPKVFALTRAVPFFERLGFRVTAKEDFPEKVWRDCAMCPLQHACDETAMVIEF